MQQHFWNPSLRNGAGDIDKVSTLEGLPVLDLSRVGPADQPKNRYVDGIMDQPITGTLESFPYDAITDSAFVIGDTVTGSLSSATGYLHSFYPSTTDPTQGLFYIHTLTGTFQDNDVVTGSLGGSATLNIPSGAGSVSRLAGKNCNWPLDEGPRMIRINAFFRDEADSLKFVFDPVLGSLAEVWLTDGQDPWLYDNEFHEIGPQDATSGKHILVSKEYYFDEPLYDIWFTNRGGNAPIDVLVEAV